MSEKVRTSILALIDDPSDGIKYRRKDKIPSFTGGNITDQRVEGVNSVFQRMDISPGTSLVKVVEVLLDYIRREALLKPQGSEFYVLVILSIN